jgi:hypothetical protein
MKSFYERNSKSHLTITFPIKSPGDAKALGKLSADGNKQGRRMRSGPPLLSLLARTDGPCFSPILMQIDEPMENWRNLPAGV